MKGSIWTLGFVPPWHGRTREQLIRGWTKVGMVVGLFLAYPFVSPSWRRLCVMFVPARRKQIVNLLKAMETAKVPKHSRVVDMGSGDARICRAIGRGGYAVSHGVERNGVLITYSYIRWLFGGERVRRSNFYYYDDMFVNFDLHSYDVVVVFGSESAQYILKRRCMDQLPIGSFVFAGRVPLFEEQELELTNATWTSVGNFGEGKNIIWGYKKLASVSKKKKEKSIC